MLNMKEGFFVIFLLSINFLSAQKMIKKTIINPDTSFIQINANNCFEVSLETYDADKIVVEATIEGEYKNDLLLNVTQEGTTVLVSTGFQPNFVNPNDKLSAHKVISIALHIKVPAYKKVQVNGTNSNIIAAGAFTDLDIILEDGSCTLNEVGETVSVYTQSGDIILSSSRAEIRAKTKYGKINREAIPLSDNLITLTSVTGDINVMKIE